MFTYDLSDNIGKIRLLIMDNQSASYLFEDAEITAFLEFEADNTRRSAALALETMASNEAYVQKKIELLDLKTDGSVVSKELRARAADLRKQADQAEARDDDGGAFDIAEMVVDSFTTRQRWVNQALRGQ